MKAYALTFVIAALTLGCSEKTKSNSSERLLAAHLNTGVMSSSGGESSGGGGGFYCPASDTVEVLDVWEGRNKQVYNFSIPESNEDYKIQIEKAMRNLATMSPNFQRNAQWHLEHLLISAKPIDSTVELPFPDDAKPKFVKPNCVVRGLMYYDGDTGTLWYDPGLIAKLSQTDLAAIWLHEGIYKYMREDLGETNSVAARRIVACALSESGCRDKLLSLEQLLPKDMPVYKCENSIATYYYFRKHSNAPNIDVAVSRYLGWAGEVSLSYPLVFSHEYYRFPTFATGPVNPRDWKITMPMKINFQGFEKTKYTVSLNGIFYSTRGGIMPEFVNLNVDPDGEDTICIKDNTVVDPNPPSSTFPAPASSTTTVTY